MAFKTIGILGGMGPAATAHFYQQIIAYCQTKYDAVQDTDFPKIIIYSLPLEGFDETGIINHEKVKQQLQQGIKILEKAGANFIVMPCNTIHKFHEFLQENSQIPILNIIEEISKAIQGTPFLLASESSIQDNLFPNTIKPSKKLQQQTTMLIEQVMKGKVNQNLKQEVINKVNDQQSVLLGCTELPLVINQQDTKAKLYDSSKILAESTVEYALF